MVSWAKVAADLDMNRKIRKAGRNAREVYLCVLRIVAARDTQGSLPAEDLDPDYLADVLMPPVTDVRDGVTRAIEVGLLRISDEMCHVVGWGDEWGRRPMTEAERASKYRASKKSKSDETENVTKRHEAVVTERDRHVGEERREEERERAPDPALPPRLVLIPEETSSQPDVAPPAKKRRGGARPARQRVSAQGATVPDDFSPNGASREAAILLGLDPDVETGRFRDKAQSKGWTYVDFQAGFRTWCGQEAKWAAERGSPLKRPPPKQPGLALVPTVPKEPVLRIVDLGGGVRVWFNDETEESGLVVDGVAVRREAAS